MGRDKKSIAKGEVGEEATDSSLALLTECEEKCKECLNQLEHPTAGAEDGSTKAVDPATIILIISTVLELIKAWRNRK